MKSYIITGSLTILMLGFLTLGVINAGTGPSARRQVSSSGGCASQVQAYALKPLSGGCASMLAPAFQARGGCASAASKRVTLAERRLAAQAARANAETTRKQFLRAASLGDLEQTVTVKAASIQQMAPIDISAEEAYAAAEVDKQSDGAPTIIIEEIEKDRPSLFGRLR
ncbi:MAG: hypothetical protein HOK57_00485 [Planctomycetaceae bacterium]|jgi:hypothetical protein|nr:hypothetical protein [Planctomycetaceae bacterium]